VNCCSTIFRKPLWQPCSSLHAKSFGNRKVVRKYKGNGKDAPVHAMKAYRQSTGTALLMLNLGTRWRWTNFIPRPALSSNSRQHQPHRWVAAWTRETAWMLWRKKNYLVVFQKWNPILWSAIYHSGSIPGKLCWICGQKKGRARNLFLLSPISFITSTLHPDISFIYLRRYIIVANESHALKRFPLYPFCSGTKGLS
jgi:hypothetical protein